MRYRHLSQALEDMRNRAAELSHPNGYIPVPPDMDTCRSIDLSSAADRLASAPTTRDPIMMAVKAAMNADLWSSALHLHALAHCPSDDQDNVQVTKIRINMPRLRRGWLLRLVIYNRESDALNAPLKCTLN